MGCQGREETEQLLPSATPKNHSRNQHGKASVKGAASAAHMLVLANMCLTGLSITQQEGNHVWFGELTQLPWANEVMELRKESIVPTLLD